jgi:hypothetical protein
MEYSLASAYTPILIWFSDEFSLMLYIPLPRYQSASTFLNPMNLYRWKVEYRLAINWNALLLSSFR